MPKPPPPETHKGKSGIARLEKRIEELATFDPKNVEERWSAEVKALQASIDETVVWVFGHDSVDYMRYRSAATLDNGPLIRGRPAPPPAVQKYLAEGKQNALLLLQQAVRGLREQLDEQEPLVSAVGEPEVPAKAYPKTVFIGHGRSMVWHQLKDFLSDRLHLACDEFNAEAVAGISTTERLQTMLDDAGFAFLVMTAEDAHADSSTHARENVIHEAGLFQGRLGFKRAIILLEGGCSQFSNIHGLTYIGFPKGNLEPVFEKIRHVLEREKML
jgi:hypothetical protein